MSDQNIRDENLRLILSKDHLDWLARERRDRTGALGILLVLFVISFSWMVYVGSMPVITTNTVYVDADETQEVIDTLEEDGYDVVIGQAPSNAEGSSTFSIFHEYGLIALLAALVTGLFAARAWYELRRIKH